FDDVVVSTDSSPGGTGTPTPTTEPTLPPGTCAQPSSGPIGFASVTALGQNGTTGGAGGPTVEVDTAAEFIAAIARTGPLVICVRGMIVLPASPQLHNVNAEKSSLGIGPSSGFTGGALNIGLPVDDAITSPP